jgi:hypothetical protein
MRHAPYGQLWHARLYSIFPHYLVQGTISEKKLYVKKMCFFIFFKTFVWIIFNSRKNLESYDKKP